MYTKFNLVFEMVNIFACIVVRFFYGVGGDLIEEAFKQTFFFIKALIF